MSDKPISTFNKICTGFSAAALIGTYAICAGAALGRGASFALISIIVCAIASVKEKNFVFAPCALLLVPLFAFSQESSVIYPALSIVGGSIICFALNKIFKSKSIPSCVIAGGAVGLALGATILLTNIYFGIGAFGATPFEMLKNYRYLGFHPDFRGLLYGTVTLFAMITYPFKFRKLNKYLPAEFITVLVPLLINIALNPEMESTTTNEYIFSVTPPTDSLAFGNTPNILSLIFTTFALGLIFYCFSNTRDIRFPITNLFSGSLSGSAVGRYPLSGYSAISAVTVIVIWSIVIIFIPDSIARLPLPCVGSMLIVSAWQYVPYRHLSAVIKEKNIVKLATVIICAVLFIFTPPAVAVFACAIFAVIASRFFPDSPKKEVSE